MGLFTRINDCKTKIIRLINAGKIKFKDISCPTIKELFWPTVFILGLLIIHQVIKIAGDNMRFTINESENVSVSVGEEETAPKLIKDDICNVKKACPR